MARSHKMACLTRMVTAAVLIAAALPATAGGKHHKSKSLELADYGVIYAGGEYVASGEDQIMAGQIYAEYFTPKKVTKKYPVVMIHGFAQTGTNFLETPDGRDGWALHFIRDGYKVYVIDQPARGRSAYHPAVNGELVGFGAGTVEQRFTAPEKFSDTWPQAATHTQWPGTGLRGDSAFDQFYASQVESAGNGEALTQAAVAALLDKIGPAIVMTHSQSGPFGWVIAEARPNLVEAIVAVEPSGPPFENAPPPWSSGTPARAWGVTSLPMTYDPPISDPSELLIEEVPSNDPNLVNCKRQQEPARQLANLTDIPVLVFSGQASYHAGYDYCTAAYLQQAGVPADYVRLENAGLPGNGHMIMLEKNSAGVAKFMLRWLDDTFGKKRHHHRKHRRHAKH